MNADDLAEVRALAERVALLSRELDEVHLALSALALSPAPACLTPKWYQIAEQDLADGVAEIAGRKAHPRIVEALRLTTHPSESDETPWCSAIGCLWLHESGYPTTRSAAARSWVDYGITLDEPRIGAICVLSRPPNPRSGHFGLVSAWTEKQILLLGGNQKDRVSRQWYDRDRVVALRWPPNAPL